MPGRRRNPARGRIDLRNPLTDHDLNVGRVGWWLTVPQRMGGTVWWDLVSTQPSVAASASGNLWSPLSRPGGWGSFHTTAGTSTNFPLPTLPALSVFSVSVWLYITAQRSWQGPVHDRLSTRPGFQLVSGSSSTSVHQPHLVVWNGSTESNNIDGGGTIAVPFTSWHHLFWAWNGTTAAFYLDGVVQSTAAGATGFSGGVPNIGESFVSGGNNTNEGYYDSVQIWNRVLSPQEAALDYRLSRQGYPGVLNRISPAAWSTPAAPTGKLFRQGNLTGLGSGGPLFQDPLGM